MNNELDLLQAAWKHGTPEVPEALRRSVERQTWMIRMNVAVEVLVAVAVLGATLWVAIATKEPEFLVLAVAVWIVTIAALIYSLGNRAGTWAPAAHDTREFLEISVRRCKAGIRATVYGFRLWFVLVGLLAAWHTWYWMGHSPAPPLRAWLLPSVAPAAILVALFVMRSRGKRELQRLEAMRSELRM